MATDIVNMLRNRTALAWIDNEAKQASYATDAKQKDLILQQRMKYRAQKLFTECIEKACVMADKNKSRVVVRIAPFEIEENPMWCCYLLKYIRESLEDAGLTVRINYKVSREGLPVATRPLIIHSIYLHISWT